MRIRIFLIVALLLTPIAALSQDFKIPDLTAAEVRKLLEQPEKVLLVDSRTEAEYRQGHIPSAINITPEHFSSIGNFLPKDKSLPIIFYCRGQS